MLLVTSTLVFSVLLASAVMAVSPSRHGARRRERSHSQLNNRLERPTAVSDVAIYSFNWAGALWDKDNVRRQSHQLCCG